MAKKDPDPGVKTLQKVAGTSVRKFARFYPRSSRNAVTCGALDACAHCRCAACAQHSFRTHVDGSIDPGIAQCV